MFNRESNELDTDFTKVPKFYHAGISWWKTQTNKRFLGRKKNGYLIDLLKENESLKKGLDENSDIYFQGEWAKFLKVINQQEIDISRLSYNPTKDFKFLPGFEEDKETSIKILGPIEKMINNNPALKDFESNSQNTNGNSILLRVDYGRARILLTGDLNRKSQQYILKALQGNLLELSADVVKSCHHGSDDCSFEFLQHVQAAATIISSGDNETHAHPRPNIVGASGLSGYKTLKNDELITPLIYSTEISRSLNLGEPLTVNSKNYNTPNGNININLTDTKKINVSYERTSSGALNPTKKTKSLDRLKIVDGIVYGLVNVRTDGDKIICAVMNEGKKNWEINSFKSRF